MINTWWLVIGEAALFIPIFAWMIWTGLGKKWWRNRKAGKGMAKKRGTWNIEYVDRPNPNRWNGYDSTTTARMIAATHDEAVALLRKYDPNFNPQHIVKSERGGIEYIVAEKNA